jgi:hypothetical protein
MSQREYRWPNWLKPLIVDSYGIEPTERRIKTEMEVGSVYRVEFDTDESTATGSVFLSPLQAKWFETFERDVLKQGAIWFKMKLFVGGEYGIEHTVRFRDRPKLASKTGDYSTYTFTLDVARREGLMDAGLAEVLSIYEPEDFIKACDLLQTVVNIEWPEALPYQYAA